MPYNTQDSTHPGNISEPTFCSTTVGVGGGGRGAGTQRITLWGDLVRRDVSIDASVGVGIPPRRRENQL